MFYDFAHHSRSVFAELSNGKVVEVYSEGANIKIALFNSAGIEVASNLLGNLPSGYAFTELQYDVVETTDGGFAVIWESISAINDTDLKLNLYDMNGTLARGDIQATTYQQYGQTRPDITLLKNGKLFVTWAEISLKQGEAAGVWGQVFHANGDKSGDDFALHQETYGYQTSPAALGLSNGNIAVAWVDEGATLNADNDGELYLTISSASGALVKVKAVSTKAGVNIEAANIMDLGWGNFAIVWEETSDGDTDIFYRIYAADGTAMTSKTFVNAGRDPEAPAGTSDLYYVNDNDLVTQTTLSLEFSGNNRLWGTDNADEISSGTGADVIWGRTGQDTIKGGNGNDKLKAGGGNDIAYGQKGGDSLFGENGGDDLFGGKGKDKLFGGSGSDFIDGGSGNDILVGNSGNDIFVFSGGFGKDKIQDFDAETNKEKIDLRDVTPIKDYDDLMKNHVAIKNGHVVITTGANEIKLIDTDLTNLQSSDFLF